MLARRKNLKDLKEKQRLALSVPAPTILKSCLKVLEPRMFSFNSPFGACPTCHGLGEITEISEDLVIPDKSKSIMDGALAVYGKMELSWRAQQLAAVGKKYGFDVFTPINKFTKNQLDVLIVRRQRALQR